MTAPPRWLLPLLLLLSACGADPAEEALSLGDDALNQFQFGQAVQHYTDAIRLDSSLATAYLHRGQAHWMGRQFGTAIDDLDRALELDPDLGWAHFLRGSSYFALDSLALALPDLQAAAAAEDVPMEDRARAHHMRAVVFMMSDRYSDGIDALSEAIDLRPDLPLFVFERGLLYAEKGRKPEAVADLERFLDADTTASEATALARHKLDSLQIAEP